MFIRVTEKETPIYINKNSIESIEQVEDICIIIMNSSRCYYAKETADDIIQAINCTNMISVS